MPIADLAFLLQKNATALVMPCGLLWLALIAACVIAWRQRHQKMLVMLLLILTVYTVTGNGWIGSKLSAWLEDDYAGIDPLECGSFDAVVVLGGGMSQGPLGQPQLNASGDRVCVGARLFHTQRTRVLVCNAGDTTTTFWRQLGVPQEAIVHMDGRNTSEEITSIRAFQLEYGWQRIGLVTSAWHMRRALRLSDQLAMELQPLPADFRGVEPVRRTVLPLLPDPEGFRLNSAALKEMLAVMVGR